jgi:hypothetical protein
VKPAIAALAFALHAAIAATAWATPSTLIWIPSTDVQAHRTWHLGVDDYFPPGAGTSAPTDVGVTYGGTRWEAGLDYLGGTDDPVSFNAKVQVLDEARHGAAAAVGIYGVGTESHTTAYNIGYGLVSKTFLGTRVTVGYFAGREHVLGPDNGGLLFGIDRSLTPKWWAAADYQEGDSAFGATSIGVAYSFALNASLIVGWVDFHDRALDDSITTQLDVNF